MNLSKSKNGDAITVSLMCGADSRCSLHPTEVLNMAAIDTVIGLDWSNATYIGDGVYLADASLHIGIPSVAVRTDREWDNHVIVFEVEVFRDLVSKGTEMLAAWSNP